MKPSREVRQTDEYNDPIIITFPGMVARVYTPVLEQEERERRMKAIHRATADVGKTQN